ncbi:MAG: serine/threonine-protein kinase [Acidobacteriota bacterium]
MIETGKVLQQRYRIDKQIGQGGMGAVYVATDERFGSIVAIKETLLMDESYRKASEREARLLNSLKHQALPRVTDHFLEDNGQFLVMEFVPGEDLGHILERDAKPFPVDDVLTWADQLLDALEYLHTQTVPVVHRDIKPQNLKLTSRGQIILLDFGLAKGNPTDAGHQTAAKSIFGYSRSYASLEQIQGTGTDPRSDLYSLAATLYHLMTAEPAEDALTRAMAVLAGGPDPLQPANKINMTIPAGVAGVLQKVMDLNAAARPASATEMRHMFRESEKYVGAIDASSSFAARSSQAILAQPTKLMPEDTRQGRGKSTDVPTEVHPGFDSEETKIRTRVPRSFASTAPETKRKSRSGLIAALSGILILCVGAFGAYVFRSKLLPTSSPSTVNTDQPASPQNISTEPPGNTTEDSATERNEAGESQTSDKGKTSSSPERSDTAKTGKPNAREKQPPADDDIGDGDSDDSTVYVGNMKVKNGRVETPDTIIDENGIRKKNGNRPPDPNFPTLTREQMQQMTPQQRRRIRQIYLRNQGGTYPTPPDQ